PSPFPGRSCRAEGTCGTARGRDSGLADSSREDQLRVGPASRGDGGYLLFLGRMTPDKGVREAA
ncbi:MAG: hypothetical protein ACRDTA_06850, partial [Pseudonocardiaceae bacterium]